MLYSKLVLHYEGSIPPFSPSFLLPNTGWRHYIVQDRTTFCIIEHAQKSCHLLNDWLWGKGLPWRTVRGWACCILFLKCLAWCAKESYVSVFGFLFLTFLILTRVVKWKNDHWNSNKSCWKKECMTIEILTRVVEWKNE